MTSTETFELTILEVTLDDDCVCDSTSDQHVVCSVEVVARSIVCCNNTAKNWCALRLEMYTRQARWGILCSYCKNPIENCWKIIPI